MFEIEYLLVQTIYFAQYARKFMTHIRLKFFMATVYLLIISIKPRAKEKFRVVTMLLFYILRKY